jgi:hypothetical protein
MSKIMFYYSSSQDHSQDDAPPTKSLMRGGTKRMKRKPGTDHLSDSHFSKRKTTAQQNLVKATQELLHLSKDERFGKNPVYFVVAQGKPGTGVKSRIHGYSVEGYGAMYENIKQNTQPLDGLVVASSRGVPKAQSVDSGQQQLRDMPKSQDTQSEPQHPEAEIVCDDVLEGVPSPLRTRSPFPSTSPSSKNAGKDRGRPKGRRGPGRPPKKNTGPTSRETPFGKGKRKTTPSKNAGMYMYCNYLHFYMCRLELLQGMTLTK